MNASPLEAGIRANIIDVANKTLAFHTSVNYQVQAPLPYEDTHEDLHADLARISQQRYASEFEFHLDLYHSFKRVNDGHCGLYSLCYDSLYVTYLPLPLVLLNDEVDGAQHIFIAPEAFKVASEEFKDQIGFWQDSLPGKLKGQLASLSGAKVLLIDGQDPFVAVDENAKVTGSYQSFATRQNSFFASYRLDASGWQYAMGNFAQQTHPLIDSVELTVRRKNSTKDDTFTIPYRSRFGSGSKNFTDLGSYRRLNCKASQKTNGVDLYDHPANSQLEDNEPPAIAFFQQQPRLEPSAYYRRERKEALNVLLDGSPLSDIDLPGLLQPTPPPLNESYSVAQFFMLDDKHTGVLALGSFSAKNFTKFGESLLEGLLGLKEKGATRLIVDVTNNGGGYICIAHWLHRIIMGESDATVPQSGLDTTTRAGPLAQLIVQRIVSDNADPDEVLSYNPTQWSNATHHQFPASRQWLKPANKLTINGRKDAFSERLGQECQPFKWDAPKDRLFEPQDILIVSNGRCASSCSLFSIRMAKSHGVHTVVVGGKEDSRQEYCGTVGGQSVSFHDIDTEIKSTKLKNHTLAPPDFLTNSVQGLTWRLGYGIDDPSEPEEWQSHWADINFPLTLESVNNPYIIWKSLASKYFGQDRLLRVQEV
ncbi:hypothetical protein CPB83DRAFT_858425 [Crepidotus variabilis]|uniref:Tail specific protease domain-containing protein n=1 Tax=Crepidotus variabilis TaxID=179855 RepID=A0A9P6JMY7_9AGAR|nr:hypothetical protein CPB83DRAFT_858425 [Crepidotus variabilis]